MRSFLRGLVLGGTFLVAGAVMPAAADTAYLHHGSHAMPDFSDVNAYELQLAQAAAQGNPAVATAEISYFARGRSAPPDFRDVNAYIASNGAPYDEHTPFMAEVIRGSGGTPDFGPVRIMEAGQLSGVASSRFATVQPAQPKGTG